MFRLSAYCIVLSIFMVTANGTAAQSTMQFPEATETVPELIHLYEDADSICRLSKSHDVKVEVSCMSRSAYGAALNERDWCYGKEGEPNATMEWHECGAASLRLPPFTLPDR
ncbi:hypothetical protein [Mesorhizobium sp. A556]